MPRGFSAYEEYFVETTFTVKRTYKVTARSNDEARRFWEEDEDREWVREYNEIEEIDAVFTVNEEAP